jgi:hypothetical protein
VLATIGLDRDGSQRTSGLPIGSRFLKLSLVIMTSLGDEFRACLRELQAAVQARWEAEARLTDLYRDARSREARAAERDPNAALN